MDQRPMAAEERASVDSMIAAARAKRHTVLARWQENVPISGLVHPVRVWVLGWKAQTPDGPATAWNIIGWRMDLEDIVALGTEVAIVFEQAIQPKRITVTGPDGRMVRVK